ncbi:MAG: metallophosphoesterase [Deltaproteobacteria bacterium]|nr:metallophosphoesterase [Deltaproteobacteria bacterium]
MRLPLLLTPIAGAALAVAAAASCDDSAVPAAPAPDASSEAEPEDTGAINDLPCPASGVSKGPWSLAMTRSAGKVRWEACRADAKAGIVIVPEAGGASNTIPSSATTRVITKRRTAPLNPVAAPDDAPGTYYTHEVLLAGLTPGACYRYTLVADPALGGRFCAAQPDGAKVHFLMIGDTNPQLGPATSNVLAKTLPRNPDFVLHGGDIQYYDSKVETWNGWFPLMRPLLAQGALMVSLGNHELELEGEDFDDYYMRFFGDESLGGRDAYFHFESGGVHFFALNSELPLEPESAQGKWLSAQLTAATTQTGYRTSIVTMHRPWVTCGDTGENVDLRTRWASPFAQAKVSVILQAHMHAYERFEVDGFTWITTGGGGGLLGNVDENLSRASCASRKSKGSFFHAMDITIEGKKLHADTIDDKGVIRDAFDVVIP